MEDLAACYTLDTAQGANLALATRFKPTAAKIRADQCFVLMPFGEKWSERIWTRHVRTVLTDFGMKAVRADDLYGSHILSDIWKGIAESRVIIADITCRNPNVMYELGLAHAMQKDVIILAQTSDDIPFDIRQHRCLIYEDNSDGYEKLEKQLPFYLKQILGGLTDNFGQPVEDDAKLILFVSYGGTCRCAMANVIMRHYLAAQEASSKIVPMSAGLVSLSKPFMSLEAQEVLKKNLKKFRSNTEAPDRHKTIHAERTLLQRANVILAMDKELLERVPERFQAKAMLFSSFFGGGSNDIDNPYRKGIVAYQACFARIKPLISANFSKALAKLEKF
jgi:protein-tyrosine-phosphatase